MSALYEHLALGVTTVCRAWMVRRATGSCMASPIMMAT